MIEFQNVSKTYPNGTHALYDVNIHIDKGEFVFIVGASGAGKSTFLKLIMHEETPTSGEIIINGVKTSRLKRRDVPYLRRHMGIVFQDFRLIDKMTVFENVAFAMRAVGETTATINKRVPYVLGLVGLKDKMKNKPNELSGGEQQRVSLARALVNNPEIIVADEPTGNVDPELSHEILKLLTEINSMGTTVLVVTHEHDLVREFNQRVITIDKGRVISDNLTSYISEELLNEQFDGSNYQDEYAEDYLEEYYEEDPQLETDAQQYTDEDYADEEYTDAQGYADEQYADGNYDYDAYEDEYADDLDDSSYTDEQLSDDTYQHDEYYYDDDYSDEEYPGEEYANDEAFLSKYDDDYSDDEY